MNDLEKLLTEGLPPLDEKPNGVENVTRMTRRALTSCVALATNEETGEEFVVTPDVDSITVEDDGETFVIRFKCVMLS